MHISNLVGQYQRNSASNSTDELKGASSMQKMVSSVSELAPGSVFEGTVTSVRGGKVTLSLSTGQQIVAQLESRIKLTVGLPMFFQVKSNQGSMMAIRPYSENGTATNPILLNALTSAGVPVTERNLEMVNAMMHRQMPINKQSVLEMVKVISAQENTSVQTLVDMARLGLPIDEELATQFEHYRANDYALVGKMESAVDQALALLGNEDASPEQVTQLNHKLLDIALNPEVTSHVATDIDQEAVTLELHIAGKDVAHETSFAKMPLEAVLTGEQMEQMTKLLQSTPALVDNPHLFVTEVGEEVFVDTFEEEGIFSAEPDVVNEEAAEKQTLNSKITVEEFLHTIKESLSGKQEFGFLGVQKFLNNKEYLNMLKNVLQEQLLIRPEELAEDKKLSETYKHLVQQMDQLEQAVKATGMDASKLSQTITDIRGNVEFMNQINQIYTYVQLPLKLSGQKANGDLYVYTNKKNLNDPEAELSAFLHLDMDNLGATDVSVKMQRKHVKTNFYFSDDMSYELVEKHLPILEAKLNKKGYTCTFSVTNEEKKVNFVNDFLRKDFPMAGEVHRYSFDVRT